MEYKFSNRVQSLKPSAIREIFKYAADPEVISLSAGNPSPEAFPTKAIEEITASILEKNPIAALQLSLIHIFSPAALVVLVALYPSPVMVKEIPSTLPSSEVLINFILPVFTSRLR